MVTPSNIPVKLFQNPPIGLAQEVVLRFVCHCDKSMLQIFFIFTILNTCFIDIPCQNSAKKYPVVLEKKFILLFLLFLVMASLDLTQFYNSETLESDHASCEICQQLVQWF